MSYNASDLYPRAIGERSVRDQISEFIYFLREFEKEVSPAIQGLKGQPVPEPLVAVIGGRSFEGAFRSSLDWLLISESTLGESLQTPDPVNAIRLALRASSSVENAASEIARLLSAVFLHVASAHTGRDLAALAQAQDLSPWEISSLLGDHGELYGTWWEEVATLALTMTGLNENLEWRERREVENLLREVVEQNELRKRIESAEAIASKLRKEAQAHRTKRKKAA